MRSILIGNGVIIQYGGAAYLNSSIVRRALNNISTGQFPKHLYPEECGLFVQALHREHLPVLQGEYDSYVYTEYDRSSLSDYKKRYCEDRAYSVEDIGFEDYFLLFELVHNKQRIRNPDRFNNRGVLTRMFVDAIYQNGLIDTVFKAFPAKFSSFLKEQDNILTTNYDRNMENVTGKSVHHLHGAFDTLSETYDPSSFRNQLSADLLDGETFDPNYKHLFSDCLVSYFGHLKSYSMTQSSKANRAIEKFADAYKHDPSIRGQIDSWQRGPEVVQRLRVAIRLKVRDPAQRHSLQYSNEILGQVVGKLDIIGLSPNNDRHLFTQLLANDRLTEVCYYCYGNSEMEDARRLFRGKRITTKDVKPFWSAMSK